MGIQRQSAPSVHDLFVAALDLPPEQRSAFLRGACPSAPGLQHAVEDLLAEHDRAGSFLKPLVDPSEAPTLDPAVAQIPRGAWDLPIAGPRFRPSEVIAGRFVVVRFIARGGMGEVYEVRDSLLRDRAYALKIIRPDIAPDPASAHRFVEEVLAARSVSHPNLCPIYHVDRCDRPEPPFLYLLMRLLNGETLDARLHTPPPIPTPEAAEICNQLVRGVGAIHDAGIVHRDLKPNNIMLERSAGLKPQRLCVYITDFGLARAYQDEITLASTGLAGTPGYLAPELLRGQQPTQATDLYALGIVMHQVLTGERPEDQQKALGVKPLPALRSAGAPPQLIQAVEDMLSDDPAQRSRAFEALHASVESTAHTRRLTPKLTRRTFLIGGAASACALAGTALWRHNQIYDLAHPLPPKRFVALVHWPESKDPRVRPMISGLLETIGNELARAEAYDRNFFVTTPPRTVVVADPMALVETAEALGTNLVLAASAVMRDEDVRVALNVLDPTNKHTYRTRELRATIHDLLALPQKAVHIAADLLDVSHYNPDDPHTQVGTNNAEALNAYNQAAALRKFDNDAGLDQAIQKYKEALELDPHFGNAQSGIAWAYLRLYGLNREPSALTLARENSEMAVTLDPGSAEAHTALAWALQQSGDSPRAQHEITKALSLDPADPHTINYEARILEGQGKYSAAEAVYGRLVKARPNFWLAHQEFGAFYQDRGKYRQALDEFQLATTSAPRSAIAFAGVGSVYLELGNLEDADLNFKKSLGLRPMVEACLGLAEIARIRHDAATAIKYAQQAVDLDSASPDCLVELADCYSASKSPAKGALAYKRAAELEKQHLDAEPNDGSGWLLLALCRAKAGDTAGVRELVKKADALHADDIVSQLAKVRTLELLGDRDAAFSYLKLSVDQGATKFQLDFTPDLDKLRADPRYTPIANSIRPSTEQGI